MSKKSILLLYGGGSSEHEISVLSANFIEKSLKDEFIITKVETAKNEKITLDNYPKFDYVIPCYHGHPGETGTIQSWLEMQAIPYLGVGPEASAICFNKVSSKLWFSALGIPNTPYKFLSSINEISVAKSAIEQWGTVFIKASNQGSSVGCFKLDSTNELLPRLQEAFKLSPYVLIEQAMKARELEVSVYQYQGKTYATTPCEIVCPENGHYSYDEKYSSDSSSKTLVVAPNISQKCIEQIQSYSIKAFDKLKLKDLSRIDFFLSDNEDIFLNEINTFPGMTSISMFPKMMENNGHSFHDFLKDAIYRSL